MTSTVQADAAQQTVLPQGTAAVTRSQVIDAIVVATGCSPELADATIKWIDGFVQQSRNNGYTTQYPTTAQMRTDQYAVFDMIMAHGAVAEPGSAAALVNGLLLDPAKGEVSVLHDQADEPDSPNYCTVQVVVGVMTQQS